MVSLLSLEWHTYSIIKELRMDSVTSAVID